MYPKKFEDLIQCFKYLPGVGEKSAQRYAFHVLNLDEEIIQQMIDALTNAKEGLKHCKVCGNISDGEKCTICEDNTRDKSIICVVQSPKDVIAMEKTNEYHGKYHVLNGVISASKGIYPDDININSLLERIKNNEIKEIILATNPTVEGETTALYIAKMLEPYNIKVTRIAHGLPMGGHLDYADELTLIKAMEGRKEI